MSLDRARFLLEEGARARKQDTRQKDAEKAHLLRARLFPAQYDFATDPARRKVALCPRQCGKSTVVVHESLFMALSRPGARVLIVARVRRQAKGTYWGDLKQLCRDFEVKAQFRVNELECELANGSVIILSGADTAEEIDKHRGQRYDLICVDECKSYSPELLAEMIREVLEPAILAKRGTLILIGTPGAIPSGLFWELTDDAHLRRDVRPWKRRAEWKGRYYWSLHSWHTQDMAAASIAPHIWEDALAAKEAQGIPDDDPTWIREYLGRWAADPDALVFAYARLTDHRCDFTPLECEAHENPDMGCVTCRHGLPVDHEWRFLLGVDLGYHDDTAYVIGAWSDTYPALVFVHAEKHTHQDIEDIATKCRELEAWCGGFDIRIADKGGLGTTVVNSLGSVYGIAFEAAKKSEKHDHIKLLNSDMTAGRIQVPLESVLVEEWRTAQWDGPERKQVDPNCDDHASDAALYLWRHCHHHWSRAKDTAPVLGTTEWWKAREKDEEERFRAQLLAEREQPFTSRFKGLIDRNPAEKLWNSRNWKSYFRS